MSFLNPVSEPVKRFKSTDAGAPQINYNSRVAGDIKAVLKACLVTGYGSTASAGWSITNEVTNTAEFVSPSAAMSDYRLGVDDTSSSSTTWYYQHQGVRVNPSYNNPSKSFANTDNLNASNGWQLFVTDRGIVLIELVQHSAVGKLSARITFLSQVKSALIDGSGANIMFFNIGHSAAIAQPQYFYSPNYPHLMLATYDKPNIVSSTAMPVLTSAAYGLDKSNVDITSAMYLVPSNPRDFVMGEIPALLSRVVNNSNDIYGILEQTVNSRPFLSVCAGFASSSISTARSNARTFLIYLDYWEY